MLISIYRNAAISYPEVNAVKSIFPLYDNCADLEKGLQFILFHVSSVRIGFVFNCVTLGSRVTFFVFVVVYFRLSTLSSELA